MCCGCQRGYITTLHDQARTYVVSPGKGFELLVQNISLKMFFRPKHGMEPNHFQLLVMTGMPDFRQLLEFRRFSYFQGKKSGPGHVWGGTMCWIHRPGKLLSSAPRLFSFLRAYDSVYKIQYIHTVLTKPHATHTLDCFHWFLCNRSLVHMGVNPF